MLPPEARELAEEHLSRLDELAPGLVSGLHVVGSAVLEDYRHGTSDLDVVVELAGAADPAALAAAHTGPGERVEALYVREGELDGPVDAVADGPWANEGALNTSERGFQLNPITWIQLAGPSVTVRGRRPRPVVDVEAAKRFCRENIVEYWQPLLAEVKAAYAELGPEEPVSTGTAVWVALGPPWLWHTVRTGEVIGKRQAGLAAARRWPDLAEVLGDVLAARSGAGITLHLRHGTAAVELGERVLTELSEAPGSVS